MEPIDFLIAWLVTGSSLLLISQLPIGIEIDSTPKAVFAAAALGILNAEAERLYPQLRLSFGTWDTI